MANKTGLVLHIGMPKTGSSYLQSCFALNQDRLAANGIWYPDHPTMHQARRGRISSGNAPLDGDWLNNVLALDGKRPREKGTPLERILLSSEVFFSCLMKPGKLEPLIEHYDLSIILFARNPVDHFLSAYIQSVKRNGFQNGLDAFAGKYEAMNRLKDVVERLSVLGVERHLFNYSQQRQAVEACVYGALGIPDFSAFKRPAIVNINRSLTASELYLQRVFNRYLGRRASKFISDPLCNKTPDIAPGEGPKFADPAVAERFYRRMETLAGEINAVEPELGLTLPDLADLVAASADEPVYQFTAEQLDVLVESLATELSPVRRRAHRVKRTLEKFGLWK